MNITNFKIKRRTESISTIYTVNIKARCLDLIVLFPAIDTLRGEWIGDMRKIMCVHVSGMGESLHAGSAQQEVLRYVNNNQSR